MQQSDPKFAVDVNDLCGYPPYSGDRIRARRRSLWERYVLIENATAEVHAARRRHQRELAQRTRLRRFVGTVDVMIEACEEAHLQGLKEVPTDLRERTEDILRRARRIVALTGDADAIEAVAEATRRNQPKIADVMDVLWTVQEVVFDLMLPWRTELPEDVELPGTPAGPWRYDSAA
jgi:hypothetical protein